jgi:type I restriction enzyme S subunit
MRYTTGIETLVPAGWRLVTMDELKTSVKYAFVGGPFGSNLTSKDYVQVPGVPVIRGTNLAGTESRFLDDGFVFVTEQKANTLVQNLAHPGDLIFTQRGTMGQIAQIPPTARYGRYLISQSQMKLTVDEAKANPRYLYFYYRSPIAAAYLKRRVVATGVPHINLEILKRFPVLLPPLPEQRRIAAILDKADAIRRKRQEAEDSSRELIPAIFRQTFGNLVTNSMTWPMAALGDVCDSRLGKMLDAKQQTGRHLRPYLRNTNVQWDRLDLSEVFEMDFDEPDRQEFELRPGDVLICEGGEVGRTAIWNGELAECYFQKAIHRVRPHPAKMCPEYLLHLMREMARHDQFRFATSQATIAHLTGVKLKALSMPLPPIELQRRFVEKVAAVKRLHGKKQEARSAADALFHSLVQRAFRGQL